MARTKRSRGREVDIYERRQLVLEKMQEGHSYRSAALALREQGVEVSHTTIASDYKAVIADLAEQQRDLTESHRDVVQSRIDLARRAIASSVKSGEVAAIREWRLLNEQEIKLWGLDAPQRHVILDLSPSVHAWLSENGFSISDIMQEFERMILAQADDVETQKP